MEENRPTTWATSVILKTALSKKIAPKAKTHPIWDRCYDFKNIFAEKFSNKLAVSLFKKCIITLVFEKKRQYFPRKMAKIAENNGHSIDPWPPCSGMRHFCSFCKEKNCTNETAYCELNFSDLLGLQRDSLLRIL
jgi:hypothetical protein